MKKYETVMILDCNITDEIRQEVINKITKYIEDNGKIERTEEIGKRKLAYEIKKNEYGYYYLIEFITEPENISELERIFKITDEIFKFIVVKIDD